MQFPSDNEGIAQRNGGLSAPIFADKAVAFFLYCARCGAPLGTLSADNLPAPARVFLKTWFKKHHTSAATPDTPHLTCADCYEATTL